MGFSQAFFHNHTTAGHEQLAAASGILDVDGLLPAVKLDFCDKAVGAGEESPFAHVAVGHINMPSKNAAAEADRATTIRGRRKYASTTATAVPAIEVRISPVE